MAGQEHPPGAIQFMEWQDTEKDCSAWYDYFRDRGIPVALVVKRVRRKVRFAVFRNWKGNPPMTILDNGIDWPPTVARVDNGFLVEKIVRSRRRKRSAG